MAQLYERREFSKVSRLIMSKVDEVNAFFDRKAPWSMTPEQSLDAASIASACIDAFRVFIILLQPVLPVMAQKASFFLNTNTASLQQEHIAQPLSQGHALGSWQPLAARVDLSTLKELFDKPEEPQPKARQPRH